TMAILRWCLGAARPPDRPGCGRAVARVRTGGVVRAAGHWRVRVDGRYGPGGLGRLGAAAGAAGPGPDRADRARRRRVAGPAGGPGGLVGRDAAATGADRRWS